MKKQCSLSGGCVPYSQQACAEAVDALGLEKGGEGYEFIGNHSTKGCFSYENETFTNKAFYGTGGSEEEIREQLFLTSRSPVTFVLLWLLSKETCLKVGADH